MPWFYEVSGECRVSRSWHEIGQYLWGYKREDKIGVGPGSRQAGPRCLHFNMDKKKYTTMVKYETEGEKQAKARGKGSKKTT